MSRLSNVKREEYKKKLRDKYTQSTESEIDEIISYLFNLAMLETKILLNDEKCDYNDPGIK